MAATYIRSRPPPQRAASLKLQNHRPIFVLHQTVGARLPAKWPANLTHLYRPYRRFRGQARSYNDGWQPTMCGMPKTVAPINVWVSQTVAPIDVWIHQTVATPPMRGQHQTARPPLNLRPTPNGGRPLSLRPAPNCRSALARELVGEFDASLSSLPTLSRASALPSNKIQATDLIHNFPSFLTAVSIGAQ